jgi:hypothetical protein
VNDNTTRPQQQSREAAIARVKKMLALGTDPRANPDEAANAMRMAEAYMRKFNLSQSEVIFDEIQRGEGIAEEEAERATVHGGLGSRGKVREVPSWASFMAVATCELFDCHVKYRTTTEAGKVLLFVGYQTDVAVCAWTYKYLLNIVIRTARKENPDPSSGVTTLQHRNQFRTGMSLAICSKIKQLVREKQNADAANKTSTALVIVKRNAIEASYGAFKYGKATTIPARTANGAAFHAGREAGAKVNVNPGRPLGHSGSNTKRLK